MERTLEKWHLSLHFRLFAIYINSCELIVPVVLVDINRETYQHDGHFLRWSSWKHIFAHMYTL